MTDKRGTANRQKPPERVILSISGDSLRTAWITLRAPLWLALTTMISIFLIFGRLSPDVASQFALALIQLAHLVSQMAK